MKLPLYHTDPAHTTRYLFFTGKGGVGKTSLSCATALKLAADMASIPAETLSLYKSIIDDGYDLALGDGLALEHARSSANNRTVTPQMVEARREAIQARGRNQG